nr:lipoprotein [Hyphomonas sp. Mor2]
MKYMIKTALALSALAGLAACGLRGDLERPPPILKEAPTEETSKPVDSAVLFAGHEINDDTTYYNTLGGEIPKPAPTVEVEEESMGEVSPG